MRKVVVVLGMHRSGTSLCMQVLNQLGIRVDEGQITADANNEKGYFECREIVELNNQILGALGIAWDKLSSVALREGWLRNPALADARLQLIAAIEDHVTRLPGIWGFKDPRVSTLLPLYEEVFAACRVEPLYVLCIRDPRSVALSLARRNHFPQLLSELLWVDCTMHAVQVAGKRIKAVVQYEKWLHGGQEQLSSLIAGLGLWGTHEANFSEDILEAAVAPNLDHSDRVLGPFSLTSTESIYKLLQNGDYRGADSAFGELQQALRWAAPGGKNTCRLCWRVDQEPFIRTTSSSVVTDVDSARRVIRLTVPGGTVRLAGLRLDAASQPGLACLFSVRLMGSKGDIWWEWDGKVATLEECETHNVTLMQRAGEPGAMAHFRDGNASIVLPVGGKYGTLPDEDGALELELAWLTTSALGGLEFSDAIAHECQAWNTQSVALREKLATHVAEADAAIKELHALRESWSWRLTRPLRFLGSFFVR